MVTLNNIKEEKMEKMAKVKRDKEEKRARRRVAAYALMGTGGAGVIGGGISAFKGDQGMRKNFHNENLAWDKYLETSRKNPGHPYPKKIVNKYHALTRKGAKKSAIGFLAGVGAMTIGTGALTSGGILAMAGRKRKRDQKK